MSVTERCDLDAESVRKELEALECALPRALVVVDEAARSRKKAMRAEFVERRRRLRCLLAVLEHEADVNSEPKENDK